MKSKKSSKRQVSPRSPVAHYRIARRIAIDELTLEVNRLMDEGWQPQGGLIDSGGFFQQAMILPDPVQVVRRLRSVVPEIQEIIREMTTPTLPHSTVSFCGGPVLPYGKAALNKLYGKASVFGKLASGKRRVSK